MPQSCVVCHSGRFEVLLSEPSIRRETALRRRFVEDRLERMPGAGELKDLTEFAHGAPAEIVYCAGCGTLSRREQHHPTNAYVDDAYDFAAVNNILPRYVEAFRAKEALYRDCLPAGSRVLEIGPHLGAFLEVASEWGWSAEGVDIGKETSAYLLSKGYTVHTRPVETCGFGDGVFDGVLVWNCFEQIEHPNRTLSEARRITRAGGLLVLRTPNGRFYSCCETALATMPEPALAESIVVALGYDNLLAFPYLYGYDSRSLESIAVRHKYRLVEAHDSELIILPFPDLPSWMVAERRSIAAGVRNIPALHQAESAGYLIAPWIELTFRAP